MKKLVGFMVLAFCVVGALLLTPGISFAQAPPPGIRIFDNDVNGISVTTFPSFTGNPVITQEANGQLGSVIWDYTYLSASPRTAPETFRYNIYEIGTNLLNPPPSALSDTLLITLSPFTGPAGGLASGHLEFYSDSLDGILPTALPNATPIAETGALQDVLLITPSLRNVDFTVLEFQSDLDPPTNVPEPMSLLFLGFGLVGMTVIGRRIKK
jgi:hypothetical protein